MERGQNNREDVVNYNKNETFHAFLQISLTLKKF